MKKYVHHVKKIKWLIPGYLFYSYYNLSKQKGLNFLQRIKISFAVEVTRFAAITIPLPGVYELTTVSLVILRTKIEKNEIEPRFGWALIKEHYLIQLIKRRRDKIIPYIRKIELRQRINDSKLNLIIYKDKIRLIPKRILLKRKALKYSKSRNQR